MPGTTAITYSNEALSIHQLHQVKECRSTRHIPTPFGDAVMKKAEKISNPGERFIVRWRTDHHSVTTRIVNGYEDFVLWAQPVHTPGSGTYAAWVQPIIISTMDEQRNNGGIIPIWKERVAAVDEHQALQFQQALLRGALASGTWVGVPGLEDLNGVNGGDTALGIIEDQTSGTNVLHGLAKTNYPVAAHPHLHNDYYDAAGDASANLLNMMQQSQTRQRIKGGAPSAAASMWLASAAALDNLKRVYRDFERYTNDGGMDDAKRVVLTFGGVPIEPIADMPNTGGQSTSNPWSMCRIDLNDGYRYMAVQGWAMDHSPVETLPGRVGTRVSFVKNWGQSRSTRPGLNTLIVDAEVF